MRTRPWLLVPSLAAALLLPACGGSDESSGGGRGGADAADRPSATSDSLSPSQVISQVARRTTAAGSSRFVLSSTTTVGGQTIELGGDGAFDYAAQKGAFSLAVPGVQSKVELRILDGTAYLQVPQQPGFYAISMKDLAGTSFGAQADPSSGLEQLEGASSDVAEAGTATVRGAATTRYTGTLDLKKAATQVQGVARTLIQENLKKVKDPLVPFEAFVDDEGRMRKLVQTLSLTDPQAGDVTSVVTTELFDFGTTVDVVAPPPSQVKDGAPLLRQLTGRR